MPPRSSEEVERDALACGVNSRDPQRTELLEVGNDRADGIDDAGEDVASVIGAADEVPCTRRLPTDGAN
jgi:hypothetical protein